MISPLPNGSGSNRYFRLKNLQRAAQRRTIASSCMAFCGSYLLGLPGGACRSAMAPGAPSPAAAIVGGRQASGNASLLARDTRRQPTASWCGMSTMSMAPSYAPITKWRGQKKGSRGRSARAEPSRLQYQSPFSDVLTPGQQYEATVFEALLEQKAVPPGVCRGPKHYPRRVVGAKGYSSRKQVFKRGA
jgi:hypothetical protein